ncbi:MAG: tetratricopeptide repeat protein [Magnetococcales bacterium]|nr:tetratricopeptide repeat protein [Magnetococcales bacterium]
MRPANSLYSFFSTPLNNSQLQINYYLMVALLLLIPLFTTINSAHGDTLIADSYHESFTQEKIEDYNAAIQALMPVYELYSRQYTINLRLGWLHYLAGRYRKSLEYYRSAASAVPGAIDPKLGEAIVGLAQQNYGDVKLICYSIIKIDYYNYLANRYLAKALVGEENFVQAADVTQKMLALYPSDINFLEQLAIIRLHQGDTATARLLYKDLWILDPNNINAFRFSKKYPVKK